MLGQLRAVTEAGPTRIRSCGGVIFGYTRLRGVPSSDYNDLTDSGIRRLRASCKYCGSSIEIARLREHLRTGHRLDSTTVESSYLEALMGVRRSRRSRL